MLLDNEGSSLQSMYKILNCEYVDVASGGLQFLPSNPLDDVWFDDEGNFSDCEDCFIIPGWIPLIGRGVILGVNIDNGESINHTLTYDDIAYLRTLIRFCKRVNN